MKFLGIILGIILVIEIVPIQDFSLPYTPILPKAYASNPNLFVSAENSQYNNYFAGPQVVQVIVSDPSISRLDQAYGEPIVTVNGKRLRMVQTTDGNWYGYFADSKQAQRADSTAPLARHGLNFGEFCSPTSASTISNLSFGTTKGVAFARTGITGASNGTQNPSATVSSTCTALAGTSMVEEHVIRENKTLTHASAPVTLGQVNMTNANLWPFVQLFDFSSIPTPVIVDYQAAGGDQVVNLTFDRIPSNLINVTPDRTAYPQNSQVFLTMNDPQLNIDPTEEDSWTWGASAGNNTLFYQAFDRNGKPDADGTSAMQNLMGNLTFFMFNNNGRFTLNPSGGSVRVADLESNGIQALNGSAATRGDPVKQTTSSISLGSEPITFREQGGVDSGVFGNWDGARKSDLITTNLNIRGSSATFGYNNIFGSIVGGYSFGTLTTTPSGPWLPGQGIPVTLTDTDENKNSKVLEHLNIFDPSVDRVPTMRIGTPFTISKANATFFGSSSISTGNGISPAPTIITYHTNVNDISQDEAVSGRPVYSVGAPITMHNTGGLVVDLVTSMQSLRNTIHNATKGNPENFRGFNFLNLDVQSLNTTGKITKVSIYLAYNAGTILANNNLTTGTKLVSIANTTSLRDFINLNVTAGKIANPAQLNKNLFAIPTTDDVGLVFQFLMSGDTTLDANVGNPIVADFFSIGFVGDGITKSQRINNAVYRWELEETGTNTGAFTGSARYQMLNQMSILDPVAYANLRTISHDVLFAADVQMLQSQGTAPTIAYLDLGADGTNTLLSTQQDIAAHSGTVSFDKAQYKVGDTATITVDDPDISAGGGLLTIYTAVPSGQDPASDTVGKVGLGTYPDGTPVGILLEVKIGGTKWSNSGCFGGSTDAGGYFTGLGASGLVLVETAAGSGIFQGTFPVPDEYCAAPKIVSSTSGAKLSAVYIDFSDSTGKRSTTESDSQVKDTRYSVPQQYRIYLRDGEFVPISGTNVTAIQGNLLPSDRVHFFLQFTNMPTPSDRAFVASKGINITDYVTGNTFIASAFVANLNNLNSFNSMNLTRWAGPLDPSFKISPVLKLNSPGAIPLWAVHSSQVVITAVLEKDADIANVVKMIKQLNGTIEASVSLIPSVTAFFDLGKVSEVAAIDDVQYVDVVDPPLVPQDDYSRNASYVTPLEDTPYSLDGKGVSVLLVDGAPPFPHPDFLSRLEVLQPLSYQTILYNEEHGMMPPSTTYQLHATGVAGVLGGDGTLPANNAGGCPVDCPKAHDYSWKGIAPGVEILAYGLVLGNGSQPDYTDNKAFDNLTTTGATSQADLGSMSVAYQIPKNAGSAIAWLGAYSPSAISVDSIVYGAPNPFEIFDAAGNQRENATHIRDLWTIDPPATAKDSISVGAIGATDFTVADFSGFGPTGVNDTNVNFGRIKPDLTAPGCSISNTTTGFMVSTGWSEGSANYVNTNCGTSEATPVAAGVGALLTEKWKNSIPSGEPMLPSTMKAILIHTATDLGNPGPDYKYGWGAINGKAAVDLVNDSFSSTGNTMIQQEYAIHKKGDGVTFNYTSDANRQVKATLVWDDPPGSRIAGQDLVNNLYLKLVSPDSKVYWPFLLDPSHPYAVAKTGNDSNNNVKMAIGNASNVAGTWRVVVYGSQMAGSKPQGFSLIVSEIRPTLTHIAINFSANQGTQYIPSWEKTVAGWWADENPGIGDGDFVSGLQYMISQGIIKIPIASVGYGGTPFIPPWVKHDAKWWSTDQIDDSQYVIGLQYMILQGIIKIPINLSPGGPPVVLTALVNDTSSSPINSTGVVYWSDGNVGGTFNPVSCVLSQGNCTSSYTPPSQSGTVAIVARYSGDGPHSASSGIFPAAVGS